MLVRYGIGKINLEIPRGNFELIKPRGESARREVYEVIDNAMNSPLGRRLEHLSRGKKVCVLVEDGTRKEPHQEIIDNLARRLKSAKKITAIIATGSHDPGSRENLRIAELIKNHFENHKLGYEVIIHDCKGRDFEMVGRTKTGTEVFVNRKALNHDLWVVGADMKFHYFAGYSNALKNFLPGICSHRTIELNHSLVLHHSSTHGTHPWHPDKERRGNVLAQDMLEAMEMITKGKVFTLSTITSDNGIIWSGSGEIKKVTQEGIRIVDRISSFRVVPRRRIVVSPGGYPEDETLYTAHRALELTKDAVLKGGEILFLAQCQNGIAPNRESKEHFYDELVKLGARRRKVKKYRLYMHKALRFAELLKKVKKIWIYTDLSKRTVEKINLHKVDDPQSVIDGWLEKEREKILIFDEANKISVSC
jgi:nickel-dependent lactate racemase